MPRIITEIKNPVITFLKKKAPLATDSLSTIDFTFASFDNTVLSCNLYLTNQKEAKGTIILLHGIRSNKSHFNKIRHRISKMGFHSIALDSRGHNLSSGQYCTFGVKEKKDISSLISYIGHKYKLTNKIGVWGQSLGGAIALQAMGYDKRICFGIIESTFSNFRQVTHDYFAYHLRFDIPIFTNYLIDRAGTIADFNPDDAIPSKYCKQIDQPILVAHGTLDKRIDIKYNKLNFENIKSNSKEFIEVKDANHLNLWLKGGNQYFLKVNKFLNTL